MKATGPIFEEPAVGSLLNGVNQQRHTNSVCSLTATGEYLVDGHHLAFPVQVADASMLLNSFLVDASAAQKIINDSGFRVLEVLPGKTLMQLLCVDYRENELGNYNEGAIIFQVLCPGEKKPFPVFGSIARMARGNVGSFVYRMPVDQEFTTHAGRFIWGFPKWVAEIAIEFNDHRATGCFKDEGELVYSISAKTGGNARVKQQRAASLAIRDGKAWKTYGTSTGSGLTFSLGGEVPKIGDSHPLALELRTLGLPKKPLFSVSMKHTAMSFAGPESVAIGQPFKT